MKKLATVLVVLGGLLAGCVAVPADDGRGGYYRDRDRDGDGVPNRLDRRPDDPRRN
jgi:hypothetical protein